MPDSVSLSPATTYVADAASVSVGGAPFTITVPRIFGCSSSLYV